MNIIPCIVYVYVYVYVINKRWKDKSDEEVPDR
jgi:hypothetical protein